MLPEHGYGEEIINRMVLNTIQEESIVWRDHKENSLMVMNMLPVLIGEIVMVLMILILLIMTAMLTVQDGFHLLHVSLVVGKMVCCLVVKRVNVLENGVL